MEAEKNTTPMAPSRQTTYFLTLLVVIVALFLLSSVILFATRSVWMGAKAPGGNGSSVSDKDGSYPFADGAELNGEDKIALIPFADDTSVIHNEHALYSPHAVLVDVSAGQVIASSRADTQIYPASMTKIMTLIVVVENIPEEADLQEMLTVKKQNYETWVNTQSSGFGFKTGQQISVEALLYFLILDSDNLAAMELAEYVAGSQEKFVEMMNQKAQAMGLENTHFVNPTGLQDEDHYSSCRDIASIMNYAMNMTLCRRVLTAESYTASYVDVDGAQMTGYAYHDLLVTKFESYGVKKNAQPDTVTVKAGKSGWTGEDSGYCLATYAVDDNGKAYVCVTAKGSDPNKSLGSFVYIEDYLTIYNNYVG